MAIHTYFCVAHDELFEIQVPFSRKHPPKTAICPIVDASYVLKLHTGVWRPSAPNFIVKEGTGALKRSPINS